MGKREEMQQKYNELAKYFGAEEGTKVGIPCRGKWRGTTDYSIYLDNGKSIFISNGMKRFEENLNKMIESYKELTEHKEDYITILKDLEKRDNKLAKEKGMKEYHIEDIAIDKNMSRWFYLILDIEGKKRTFVETSLNSAIWHGRQALKDYVSQRPNREYFEAGAVKDADFIFASVGFNSSDDLYKPSAKEVESVEKKQKTKHKENIER